MKIKALFVAAVFVAGLAGSVALAQGSEDGPQTTTSTTAAASKPSKPKCEQVELKGTAAADSITFTVTKANKRGKSLVGTTVALVVPEGAKVRAKACSTGETLTLRDLHLKVPPATS
jgi:hypothetical protein